MAANILDILKGIIKEDRIKMDEPLYKHTTFRIGGAAKYFVAPCSEEEAASLIKTLEEKNIKYYILGNGSNVLADDEGYDGVIIYIGENMANITVLEDGHIEAQAGAMLGKTAITAMNEGLSGMEFAAGIPGSVGGAVVMNAGAYGGEIKDIIVSARVCDKQGNIFDMTKDELDLSYRHSVIMEKEYLVLSFVVKLEKGDKDEIKAKINELALKRKEKQPLEYPSAGSTFKRPEGYFAGKLIEDAGLRGYQVGGAKVSDKHCGFVINESGATSKDVMQVIEDVGKKVNEQFGVTLEPEVRIIK